MNILPKKKWHVRTKENMARVRRDEAKAAEEEQRRLDRTILAENERRLQALRSRADQTMETMFGADAFASSSKDVSIHDDTGHVNFFQDLEREERKNLGTGNKEYEEEKKKEQHEWESKMGIQKMLAEDTNELNKKKEWYEAMPMRTSKDVKPVQYVLPQLVKRAVKEKERKRKKEKKKRRHSSSDSSSDSSEEDRKRRKHKKKKSKRAESEERRSYESEKKQKLAALRDERMKRERAERLRQEQLLYPEKFKAPSEPKQKYNSQFNPHLARR